MFLLSLLAYRICPSYFCQAQYSFFLYGCVFVLLDASCIAILRKKCDLFYKSWWYEELGVLQAFNLWSVLGEPEIIISRRLAMFHFLGGRDIEGVDGWMWEGVSLSQKIWIFLRKCCYWALYENGSTESILVLNISKTFDRVDHYALFQPLIKVGLYLKILLKFFWIGYQRLMSVGLCFAPTVYLNILPPVWDKVVVCRPFCLLYSSVYMDVLIIKFNCSSFGCLLCEEYFGCFVYDKDVHIVGTFYECYEMYA